MPSVITSLIRTVVPIVVGWLLSLGAVRAAGIDEEQLTGLLTGLLTVLAQIGYYAIARLLEQRWPAVGVVLLGSRRQPQYEAPAGP